MARRGFRALERRVVERVAPQYEEVVFATGGGIVREITSSIGLPRNAAFNASRTKVVAVLPTATGFKTTAVVAETGCAISCTGSSVPDEAMQLFAHLIERRNASLGSA